MAHKPTMIVFSGSRRGARKASFFVATLTAALGARSAHAEPYQGHYPRESMETPASRLPPAKNDAPKPEPTLAELELRADRATFNGWRFVGEMVAGTVVGSAAGYGTYALTCDPELRKECDAGPPLAAFGANLLGASAGVYATGRLFGGEGGFGWTLLGVTTAFAGCPLVDPATCVSFGLVLAPITGALSFEFDSHREANALRKKLTKPTAAPYISPRAGGAVGGVRGTF